MLLKLINEKTEFRLADFMNCRQFKFGRFSKNVFYYDPKKT